jgi:mono/diheme cytochrome c family protein
MQSAKCKVQNDFARAALGFVRGRVGALHSADWKSAIQQIWKSAQAGCVVVLAAAGVSAAEVDVARLPLAATNVISFDEHVRPILERSCIRCHGPERPKSGYRLDNRESALKGGDNGVAVITGKSAESPLIHYVAGLVEDMKMPPKGKGDPLTTEEIALLRGWIDQGAPWGAERSIRSSYVSVSPTVRWITVDGNSSTFREHAWQREYLTAPGHARSLRGAPCTMSIAWR